jgi:hypothetical protein
MYQFDLKGFSIDFSLNLLNPKIPRGEEEGATSRGFDRRAES